MTNLEFEAWLSASRKDVEGDWQEFVDSVGDVELFETMGLTRAEATDLVTDGANEAFRDFALQEFEDSRDFSNSGL